MNNLKHYLTILISKKEITFESSINSIQQLLVTRFDVEFTYMEIEAELLDLYYEWNNNFVIEIPEDYEM